MQIPFVIDNQIYKMSEVLNRILAEHTGKSLDIATAYFNVGGWELVSKGLKDLGNFRLLLGDEPEAGSDLGLREIGAKPVKGLIKDLSQETFSEKNLRLVEELIAFLRREDVQVRLYNKGFLHAKCYLFYTGSGYERYSPLAAIVGSSNFTRPGLTTNKELNLSHRVELAPEEISLEPHPQLPAPVQPALLPSPPQTSLRSLLEKADRKQLEQVGENERKLAASVPGLLAISQLSEWYAHQWEDSFDFKDRLIDLLNSSKFGQKEYSPFQVYLKALFEYFRDDIVEEETDGAAATRSAVELSEFQEDAVKKARKILARYDGVIVSDSVGLGKTWIGKKLLEDYAYHLRYRAVVICPASLRKMWEDELRSAAIAVQVVTQEVLGRAEFDPREVQEADIILVDESHNFRNRNAQRYENLERILAGNNRHGRVSGERKKLILLTATPINNTVFDLYNQINLFTGGDRGYFAAAGIGDLQKYFIAVRKAHREQDSAIALFNLLEEVMIRRTRPFIKAAYPNATIKGNPISWPERKLKTIRYNLEATYSGIYHKVVSRVDNLRLAPYRLESYKKSGIIRDEFEEGREEALVGIFKSRYLKRFESSVEAFRISVRRALEFLETFESYILDGKVLDSRNFQKAMRYLAREDEEDDATEMPGSLSDDLDLNTEASAFIATLPILDPALYDLKRLHKDVRKDVDALREIWQDIVKIIPAEDAKLARLKELLAGELKGQKVLLFTYYKDTARYLYKQLTAPELADWRESADNPHIRRMDSGADPKERTNLVAQFSPISSGRPELAGTDKEIDLLISTDVLSEGQNLQDCGLLINYDLHWNPTRMVQRAGRIDRIGTAFKTLWVHNMFPDDGLEELLGLVQSLSQKITNIDRAGLLDTSVLGEVVHPQNFNVLRRIEQEDGQVVEEQEQFLELASSEYLLQNLKNLLEGGMREKLEELPDGIHSGLSRQGAKGVFFYFTAGDKKRGKANGERRHYWRYVDLTGNSKGGRIEDNRYLISNLIQCQPDTPRVVPSPGEVDIFDLQEKVIASILQAAVEQVAVEEAPPVLDPIQQTVATTLRSYINNPTVSRKEVIAAIQRLAEPQPGVHIKGLRKAYEAFIQDGKFEELLAAVKTLGTTVSGADAGGENKAPVKREDLRLICFDYIW